jgi:hypothetical protein
METPPQQALALPYSAKGELGGTDIRRPAHLVGHGEPSALSWQLWQIPR